MTAFRWTSWWITWAKSQPTHLIGLDRRNPAWTEIASACTHASRVCLIEAQCVWMPLRFHKRT